MGKANKDLSISTGSEANESSQLDPPLTNDDIISPSGQPAGAAPHDDWSPTAAASEQIRVEVVCGGVLGPRLLKKGDVTSDPAYVRLIGDTRNLVRPV